MKTMNIILCALCLMLVTCLAIADSFDPVVNSQDNSKVSTGTTRDFINASNAAHDQRQMNLGRENSDAFHAAAHDSHQIDLRSNNSNVIDTTNAAHDERQSQLTADDSNVINSSDEDMMVNTEDDHDSMD